jgi:hypothetical protein
MLLFYYAAVFCTVSVIEFIAYVFVSGKVSIILPMSCTSLIASSSMSIAGYRLAKPNSYISAGYSAN